MLTTVSRNQDGRHWFAGRFAGRGVVITGGASGLGFGLRKTVPR